MKSVKLHSTIEKDVYFVGENEMMYDMKILVKCEKCKSESTINLYHMIDTNSYQHYLRCKKYDSKKLYSKFVEIIHRGSLNI